MDSRLDLSVAIITFNEEKRLGKTLESVSDIASEIIVIDSDSTDATVEIAYGYGAKVYNESWKGFAGQKNSLTEKVTSKWILYLDADEVLSEELKNSIKEAVKQDNISGYYINRKTHYLGRLLKYSWQPDKRLRFVRRDKNPLWVGEVVHEELKIEGRTSILSGYLIHYSYNGIKDHFTKTIRYAELSAESYYKRGKRPSLMKLLFSPVFSFLKLYVIKLGFLDGIPGLIAGVSAYVYVFLKYTFLWDMYRRNR